MTVDQVLAMLPANLAPNTRALLTQMQANDLWLDVVEGWSVARVTRWVSELRAGRTDDDLRDDILNNIGAARIATTLGVTETTASRIILGANEGGVNLGTILELPKVRARLDSGAVDADDPVTDTPPANVNGTTLPTGGRLVRVRQPAGSDAPVLNFVVYQWNGITLSYEIGDDERLNELFGSIASFDDVTTFSQTQYDSRSFVDVGSVDQIVGSDESIGSQIQREVRALGLEDLPRWLSNSPDALALVAQATAQDWSSGRLWKELSTTEAFQLRFGRALPRYLQGGVSIQQAVDELVADETAFRESLRQYQGTSNLPTHAIHAMLNLGWTAASASQVLGQMAILEAQPEALTQANLIMEAAGLPKLDQVSFLNGINGHGPIEVVKALNAAAAGVALREAGIDVADQTIDLLLDLMDTADRVLTVDSFQELAQQLSFNMIRFGSELDFKKLGIGREDLIAGAFGEESPTGKSSGQVLDLLARFERDRRAAGEGFEDASAFQDKRGRLIVQGLAGL